MAKKKYKMEYDYEKMGSQTLRKAALLDELAVRGTLDDYENETADAEAELENDVEPRDLKKELEEHPAFEKKKKKR
ncbi:MAG: hypothetical protein QXO69_01495 [archaeon]